MPSPQQENQWPCMVTPPISYVSKSLTEVPNNTNGVVQQSHECRSYVCRAGGFLGTSLIRTDKFSVVYCESVNLIGYITVFYLNNRVFLSRNYRLIVAQRKFDVLKTNICLRSEASRANMLVLRTSNFQEAAIRPIIPRQTLLSLLFTTKFSRSGMPQS